MDARRVEDGTESGEGSLLERLASTHARPAGEEAHAQTLKRDESDDVALQPPDDAGSGGEGESQPAAEVAADSKSGRARTLLYATACAAALVAIALTPWMLRSLDAEWEGRGGRPTADLRQLPEIRLTVPAERLSASLGKATALPVGVEPAAVPAGSFVLVRGVPERAMLSSGKPFGAGTWIVEPAALPKLSLTIFAAAAEPTRIGVELLSSAGVVMARGDVTVHVAPAGSSATATRPAVVPDRVTYPPLKAETAQAVDPGVRSERPLRSGRKLDRATAPVNVKPRLTGVSPQVQPKAKSAWSMNWGELSTGR
jgi:hypothetical protein